MLKVGSQVTIRNDLRCMTYYGKINSNAHDAAVEEMLIYKNKVATITKVNQRSGSFRLDIDDGRFNWVDSMFEDKQIFYMLNKDNLNHCDNCTYTEKCKVFKSLYENETICSILDLIDNL